MLFERNMWLTLPLGSNVSDRFLWLATIVEDEETGDQDSSPSQTRMTMDRYLNERQDEEKIDINYRENNHANE